MPDIQEDQFREALQGAARRVVERKRATDPSGHFPWHELQEWTFDAPNLFPNPLRVMLLVGGNRSGKSKLAMGHIDKILQRSSPVNEQLMTTDPVTGAIRHKDESDPIRMWVIPPTMEKFRTDWVWPTDGMGLQHFMGDRFVKMRENPDFMFIGKPPGVETIYDEDGELDRSKCDILIGKSQDQKLETFESSEIDVAVFDEEPTNRNIVTSTMMRVATSNGVLIFSYTPLHGLCLPGDTRVTTGRGMVPIREARVGDRVSVRNRVATVTDVHENGVRPLVEVRTRRGYTLRCTPEHEWLSAPSLTRDDHLGNERRAPSISEARKVKAHDLTGEDWVAFNPGHHKFWPDSDLAGDDGYFIGQMVGDGSWRSHPQPGPMKLTTSDPETVSFLHEYLSGYGVVPRAYPKTDTTWSVEWCDLGFASTVEGWGVDRSQKTADKRVPECVWRGSREVVREFLRGLFDSDGHADQSRTRVSFATTSEGLSRDVMRLLVRFAIFGSLYEYDDGDDNHATRYTVEVTGANARRFMHSVGFRLPRKADRDWVGSRNGPGSSWDRVVSVRELGTEGPVYCLTVDDDDHVFAADGFVSGNSWSYDLWWKPLIKQSRAVQVGERRWIHAPGDPEMGGKVIVQMGMADNPRAAAYAKEILADPTRTEAEKAARVYGEYGYVEGALIEKLAGIDLVNPNPEHKKYVVHELPEDPHIVDWYLVADPNKSYGALLGCLDSDGNLFFVAEHLKEGWPNRLHAEKFKQMEYNFATGPVQRYADPGSAGAQAIIDLEDFGLYFDTVEKGAGSVSRSIKRLRGMAWEDPDHFHPITGEKGAPRIYFYAPGLVSSHEEEGLQVVGSQLAEQISNARQKEDAAPDTPDKDSQNRLDLWDCARYMADIVMVRGPVETDSRLVPKDRGRLPSDKDLLASQEEESYKLDAVELWTPDYSF